MIKKNIILGLVGAIPFGLIMFMFEYFDRKEIDYGSIIFKTIFFTIFYILLMTYNDRKKLKDKK